jgi:hypothetical protein
MSTNGGSQTADVGYVHLLPIRCYVDHTLERLWYVVGGAESGSVRMAIYNDGGGNLPDGGNLVAETNSVAQATADYMQLLAINQALLAGNYWIALQVSLGSTTFNRTSTPADTTDELGTIPHQPRYYVRGGGYGAFTNPCPNTTKSPFIPWMGWKVASVDI